MTDLICIFIKSAILFQVATPAILAWGILPNLQYWNTTSWKSITDTDLSNVTCVLGTSPAMPAWPDTWLRYTMLTLQTQTAICRVYFKSPLPIRSWFLWLTIMRILTIRILCRTLYLELYLDLDLFLEYMYVEKEFPVKIKCF